MLKTMNAKCWLSDNSDSPFATWRRVRRAFYPTLLPLLPYSIATAGGTEAAGWNNAFAGDMLVELIEENRDQNIVFSPFSIFTAFGMTYAGARGDTAAQMEEVFRFAGSGETPPAVADWMAAIEAAAQGESIELSLANRTWFQEEWVTEPEYLQLLEDYYNAPPFFVDFRTEYEATRQVINDWVYEQTRKRIADLLPEEALDALTRFVLVNALYFRAFWEVPFPVEATSDVDFHVSDEETITVAMMLKDHMPVLYATDEIATAIALSVKDGDFSFVAVLPAEGKSLEEVAGAIAAEDFSLNVAEWTPGSWQVHLPRFRVEASVELKKVLSDMGVVDAFVPHLANFTGIYNGPEPELHITDAFHKAFVEVNEIGMEAAAATAVVGGITSVPPVFKVDRPFLFFITENTTGTVLFGGQVMRPEDPGPPEAMSAGYDEWRHVHFSESDRYDTAVSGPQAAAEVDGVKYLLKYALGVEPEEPALPHLPRLHSEADAAPREVAIEFVRSTGAEIEWHLQASKDLASWRNVDFRAEILEPLPDGRERVRFLTAAGDDRFYRVRVRFP